jgi:hypothetical protein
VFPYLRLTERRARTRNSRHHRPRHSRISPGIENPPDCR